MKIDVSRDTYRPYKHFTRVLMQQGRVQLDADWNEQAEILLHQLRWLAADWGGHGWGPGNSFRVERGGKDVDGDYPLYVEPGHYYVAGILCDDGAPPLPWTAYTEPPQPAHPPRAKAFVGPAGIKHVKSDGTKAGQVSAADAFSKAAGVLVVLRVRERLVTALEDPHLRELALGGPDTAARTQVRFAPHVFAAPEGVTADTALYYKVAYEAFRAILDPVAAERERAPGRLAARAHAPDDNADPCVIRSGNAYRGLENQLFRVEISTPGDSKKAKFVFAPDNGSLVARYKVEGKTVVFDGAEGLAGLSGFARGDYVELTDDEDELRDRRGTFYKVKNVAGNVLTLDTSADVPEPAHPHRHPKARRWSAPGEVSVAPQDRPGKPAKKLSENLIPGQRTFSSWGLQHLRLSATQRSRIVSKPDDWIPLSDGVEVRFDQEGNYQIGDYWLIPARTITGNVEWPMEDEPTKPPPTSAHHEQRDKVPRFLPPRHLSADEAPLAFLEKPASEPRGDRPDGVKPPLLIDLRRSVPAPVLPGPPAPPTLPTSDGSFKKLQVDRANLSFRLFAAGIATYQFNDAAPADQKWKLAALSADLLDERGGIVGRHYFPGPDSNPRLVWEGADGSHTEADPAATTTANAPGSNQLAWTLDKTTASDTFGLFNKVTQVQRLFVVSTPVPAHDEAPPAGTKERKVNFLATYYRPFA